MGFIERILGWAESEESEAAAYRCLSCGAGHDRPYTECRECGGRFVAETDAEDHVES